MKVGYARVSTIEQDTALQISALRAAQCRRIVQEKRSAVKHRPMLEQLLSQLKPGDVLVVYKLDRLARSLQHLLQILEQLNDKGASIKSLTEPISTDTAAGRMMVQVLGAVAEFERAIIRERCMAGMLEAMKAGKRWGRPSRIPYQDRNEIIELIAAGMPSRAVADAYAISQPLASRLHREAIGRQPRKLGQLRALLDNNKYHTFA